MVPGWSTFQEGFRQIPLFTMYVVAEKITSQASVRLPDTGKTCSLQYEISNITQPWWSQTGSNRRPPACKAGALPTELWPLIFWAAQLLAIQFLAISGLNLWCSLSLHHSKNEWWAWVDLNYRPHAYQACALTRLSYRP